MQARQKAVASWLHKVLSWVLPGPTDPEGGGAAWPALQQALKLHGCLCGCSLPLQLLQQALGLVHTAQRRLGL